MGAAVGEVCEEMRSGALPSIALAIQVRDMGNGVDRIEAVTVISFCAAQLEQDKPHREPLRYPLTERIADLVEASCAMVRNFGGPSLVRGFSHAIDDRAFRLVFWRASAASCPGTANCGFSRAA